MNKLIFGLLSLLCLCSSVSVAQIMEMGASHEGILFPRYPNDVRPSSPEEGLCIYNTDLDRIECFDGQDWLPMSGFEAVKFYLKATDQCGMLDETGVSIADVVLTTCNAVNFTCGTISDLVLYEVKVGSQPLLSDYDQIVSNDEAMLINTYPGDGTLFWISVNFLDANNDIIGQALCSYTAQFTIEPPDPDSTSVSYTEILANAPDWTCLTSANEYLAEFLRQNPEVNYWEQNHAEEWIATREEPEITGTIVNITPSGGDDTQLIEAALTQAGDGGAVDGGNQVFLINDLDVGQAGVTLRNINLKTSVNSIYRGVRVNVPDVTFLRVNYDLENKQHRIGIEVQNNADRFALVESRLENLYNTSGTWGAFLRLYEGTDDVYIINNEFVHGIANEPSTGNSSIRGIWVASTNVGVTPKGGIIASNYFEDFQSNGQGKDADGMVFQGFDLDNQYQMGFRLAVLANVGVNAGKRLMKLQSGGIDAHSNVNHWKDLSGELGVRQTRCHYDNQGTSNCRWTNNLAITDHSNPGSESFFMQMQTNTFSGDIDTENIEFQCNKYIHNDDTSDGRSSYAFVVMDFNEGTNGYNWPADSYIKDNVVEGSGTLRFFWWFKLGNDPMGTQFDHLQNNQILVNYESLYR